MADTGQQDRLLSDLLRTSQALVAAAKSADWKQVQALLQKQDRLLKGQDGTPTLTPGPQGVSEEAARHAHAIEENWAEVQVLLNNQRQKAADQLAMLARLKQIRKGYGNTQPKDPRFQDRKA